MARRLSAGCDYTVSGSLGSSVEDSGSLIEGMLHTPSTRVVLEIKPEQLVLYRNHPRKHFMVGRPSARLRRQLPPKGVGAHATVHLSLRETDSRRRGRSGIGFVKV